MSDIKMTNIPSMNVGKMVEKLSSAYCAIIQNNYPIKTMPSVMLWGPPGVGKSQAVRRIAKEIGEKTGKTVNVTDVRLLLFNPIDLRGIPTANADKTLAVWLKPQIFQMDASDDIVNILFLDEISAAPQSVQAAAYQITLDRVVGEHKLPENCIVIAAGNRVTDKSVAFKMPKALANRLMHIEIEGSFSSWKQWAISSGINDSMYYLIAGLVGTGAAVEFRTWAKVYKNLPAVEDIFDGKMPQMPKDTDVMYALMASMTAYARMHKDEMSRIANSIRYADKMPPDFSAVLLKDYMCIDKNYKEKLMTIPEFARWLQTKEWLINGSV